MKIEKISIDGIRGFNSINDENGDAIPHIIALKRKHLFLFGENGTGKSSLFDAIEWCLTGDIEESSYRRIKNKKNFIINKHCSAHDNPFVEIDFKTTTFKRELKNKNDIFGLEDEAKICLVEPNRIENFVVDTKSALWQRFFDLLGLNELTFFDRQLTMLKNESNNKYKHITSCYNNEYTKFEKLKRDLEDDERHFHEQLGDGWILTTNKDDDDSERYVNLNKMFDSIETLLESYTEYNRLNELNSSKEELLLEEQKNCQSSHIAKIIDETYNYFNDFREVDTCPICNNKIEFSKVFDRLVNLKRSFSKIFELEDEIDTISRKLESHKRKFEESRNIVNLYYYEIYDEKIDDICDDDTYVDFIKAIKNEIENEKLKFGKIVSMKTRMGTYQQKKKEMSRLEESLDELNNELKIRKKCFDDINEFYNIYLDFYISKITSELNSVKSEVMAIYNAINQSENEVIEDFTIKPDISKKEINFQAKIHGKSDEVDALDVLSTGHVRCLGFAFLIARIRAKSNKLKFVVIDDPIYSIDQEHRYNLINYLYELGKSYQLIITTSDRLFFDILRHIFEDKNFVSYTSEIMDEMGIINCNFKVKDKQYIDEARKHLADNDLRASSLYARLSLETSLFKIAEKINLKIPINRIEKLSTRDLTQRFKLKREVIAAYPDLEEEINNEFDKINSHRYFKSLLNGFPLDQEVHHPTGINRYSYSKHEIDDAIKSIEEFNDFINNKL